MEKEIVAKALSILAEKEVGSNISSLLKNYRGTGFNTTYMNQEQADWSKLPGDIKTKDNLRTYKYGDDILQIAAVNDRRYHDIEGRWGDLYVLFNKETVLISSYSGVDDEWGNDYSVSFYDFNLKLLKLGNWVSVLKNIKADIAAFDTQKEIEKKDAIIKAAASNIDLGEFG